MTTRRSFLSKLALGVAGFTILPSATTYARSWKKTDAIWVLNDDWKNARYEIVWITNTHWKHLDNLILHVRTGVSQWTDHLEPKPFPKLNLK